MKKTRLNKLFLTVSLVATMFSIFFLLPNPVYATDGSWQVSQGTDDVVRYSGGEGFKSTTPSIYVGYKDYVDYYSCDGFFRWENITIPQGYSVQSACIKIYINYTVGTANIRIYGIDEDNATTFSVDPSSRSLTTDSVDWTGTWTQNAWNTSPNITFVIQEITDRAGWASGNSLALKLDNLGSSGNNYFEVCTYEGDPAYSAKLEVTYAYTQYCYTMNGLFDEETGNPLGVVSVTAYFPEGTSPVIFDVNGEKYYRPMTKPIYFRFDLVNDREYWLSDDEDTATIYIFNATTTIYTLEFIDLTNQLDEYSYVSAKRQVNGTLHTVDKRKANKDDKVIMALIQYAQYSIYIRDGVSYDYGEVVFTTDTTVQLTLTGLEFPSNIVEGYKYVRCWAYRNYASPNTTYVNYQDLQEYTTNVTITHYFINDTVANATWSASDTFISTWTGADENTTYYVVVSMERSTGTMTYRQTLPRAFSSTNPWGIDFLWNSAPFNTNILIPAFIIICVAGVFSALNARVGALATVATSIVLMAVWGLSITQEAIILALALVIMMGVIYGKGKVMVG